MKNNSEDKTKIVLKNLTNKINSYIFPILKTLGLLVSIGVILFVVFSWDFSKADKIFSFLEISLWPIIALIVIFLFKNEISTLINKGIVIILPGGHEVRLGQSVPPQETIQKNPESKKIEDYNEIKKQYEDKIETLGAGQQKLKTELINAQIYLDFERIYRVIFGSQIDLLKRIRSVFPSGELSKDTIFFFVLTQRLFSVFSNWTFDQYMLFLFNAGVITHSNDRYFITEKGKAFLAYIEILNYPKKDL